MDKNFWRRDRHEAFLHEDNKRNALRADRDRLKDENDALRALLDESYHEMAWGAGEGGYLDMEKVPDLLERIEAALRGEGGEDG